MQQHRERSEGSGGSEIRVYTLTPDELAARFGTEPRSSSWATNRRRNRAAGVDRFGRPLARVAGTNPRAAGTNPRGAIEWVDKRQGVQR
jgi:hypothetical protein